MIIEWPYTRLRFSVSTVIKNARMDFSVGILVTSVDVKANIQIV